MNRKKQIVILVLAVVLLVGGIYVVARSISQKNQGKLSDQTTQQVPADMFGHASDPTANAIGNVSFITEKTLTIAHLQNATGVNITGTTPVAITVGANQPTIAQIADVKVGDAVNVTYDQTTKKALMISVIRPEMETQNAKK